MCETDRLNYLQLNRFDPTELQLLLKRAVLCVKKAHVIQRDGVGIRDLLPRDVGDDIQVAQRNIQAEMRRDRMRVEGRRTQASPSQLDPEC